MQSEKQQGHNNDDKPGNWVHWLSRRVLYTWLCLFPLFLSGQDLSTIREQLQNHPEEDSLRAAWLITLGWKSKSDSLELRLQNVEEGHRIYKNLGYSKPRLKALSYIFWLHRTMGNLDAAWQTTVYRMVLALELRDSFEIARTHDFKSMINWRRSKYEKAIQELINSLSIYKGLNNQAGVGRATGNIGLIYRELNDFEKAKQYYKQGLAYNLEAGNDQSATYNYLNLGEMAMENGNLDSAASYFLAGYALAEKIDDDLVWATIHHHLCELYLKKDSLEKATFYLDEFEEVLRNFRDINQIAFFAKLKGQLFARQNNPDSAVYWLKKAEAIWAEQENLFDLSAVLTEIADLQAGQKNWKGAFESYARFKTINDSLRIREARSKVEEMTVKYETEKKEADLAILRQNKKESQQRQSTIIFGSILGGTILFAAILYLAGTNYRRRKIQQVLKGKNQQIEEKNTALEQKNKQLEYHNRMKDTLMGIVAHDLKAPINKAEALSELLESMGPLNENQQEMLDLMRKVFDNGRHLIEELTLLGKLEASTESPEFILTDIRNLVAEARNTFLPTATKKSISLEYQIPESPLPLETHREYLSRVLDNLISNAIKFSPPGKKVWLTVGARDEDIRISVKDEGPGIPREEQSRLFQKFTRLSNQPTAGESSTGLGLSIVKQLMEKLKGRIEVDSTVGYGTEFILTFPKH